MHITDRFDPKKVLRRWGDVMGESAKEEAIARIVSLLNSKGVGYEAGHDLLAKNSRYEDFCRATGYAGSLRANARTLHDLRGLREALLAMVQGVRNTNDAFVEVDTISARYGFCYVFDSEGGVSAQARERSVVSEVLADVAVVSAAKAWDRIKICANDECGAVFFDPTRAKNRRWHSFDVCGNKSNVAAFRARTVVDER